ncbi:MAG: ferritin [Kosmotogaceae bacterium]
MISEKLVKLINDQIKAELESEYIYLAMAVWCAKEGFTGAYSWLIKQSEEEHEHAMKFIEYLKSSNADVVIPSISKPDANFDSLIDVFQKAFEHEKYISSRIFKLVDSAVEEDDKFTEDFLSWYVEEQREEETTFNFVVKKLKLIGSNIHGLMMVDSMLANRED